MQRSVTGPLRAALVVGTLAALACVVPSGADATAFTYQLRSLPDASASLAGYELGLDEHVNGTSFLLELDNAHNHRVAGYGLSGSDAYVGWGWTSHSGRSNVYASDEPFAGEGTEPVPEPTTLALLGMGLAGTAFAARRRRKQPQ